MRKQTLQKYLLEYINSNEGWHKKVSLFVLGDKWGYSPDSLSRQLRNLAEEGKIQVSYYDGKFSNNLAMYSRLGEAPKKTGVEIITREDGTRIVVVRE